MFRDITERKRDEDALRRLNEQLSATVAELRRHDREVSLLNQLNELVQTCHTPDEAYRVVEITVAQLLPEQAGWLAVREPLRPSLEVVAQWGAPDLEERSLAVDDCWALRRGQPHEVTDPRTSLVCRHIRQPQGGSLCLPLVVQGETLGLLHVAATAGNAAPIGRQLLVALGETVKLSLSNLRLRQTLREQAIRDPLTGVLNRRSLDETLPRELRRCVRHGLPVTVAVADVDHFKQVNDSHGHEVGDRFLRELGNLLQEGIRASDLVCRLGGEEFVIVMPESAVEAVLPRLGALRERVRLLRLETGAAPVEGVTLSIGVAQAPDHATSPEELLRAADAAVFVAKRAGRNRLVVHGQAPA